MGANYTGPPSPKTLEEAGHRSWDEYLAELATDAGAGFSSWEHYFVEEDRIAELEEKGKPCN